MGGLRYESVADLPENMRRQLAGKLKDMIPNARPVPSPDGDGLEWLSGKLKENKYHNTKVAVSGISFDSKKEARRYQQLMAAQQAGAITDLRMQVDFTLQEAYTTPDGQRIRAIRYRADFTYKVSSAGLHLLPVLGYEDIEYWRSLPPGSSVVEDVKSRATKTKDYILKKKMMADKGYIIREV